MKGVEIYEIEWIDLVAPLFGIPMQKIFFNEVEKAEFVRMLIDKGTEYKIKRHFLPIVEKHEETDENKQF